MDEDYKVLIAVLVAISGWVAVGVKVLLPTLLSRAAARRGTQDFIEGRSVIFCDIQTEDGQVFAVDYFPDMGKFDQYSRCTRFRIEIDGHLLNDTDTQYVYFDPLVEFWGVEGPRMMWPRVWFAVFDEKSSEWSKCSLAKTITVPAHSAVRVRFVFPLGANFAEASEAIMNTYQGTVALLKINKPNGRQLKHRICTRSFCGSQKVVWPSERRFPIYNIYDLNKDGRRAGKRPQDPSPCIDTAEQENAGDANAA